MTLCFQKSYKIVDNKCSLISERLTTGLNPSTYDLRTSWNVTSIVFVLSPLPSLRAFALLHFTEYGKFLLTIPFAGIKRSLRIWCSNVPSGCILVFLMSFADFPLKFLNTDKTKVASNSSRQTALNQGRADNTEVG